MSGPIITMTREAVLIRGKRVDVGSIEVDGVDAGDYPDYCDAYVMRATFEDGEQLTDSDCEALHDQYSDLVYDIVAEVACDMAQPYYI